MAPGRPLCCAIFLCPPDLGQREHRGEIVARGAWPAILTSSQTARLRSLLGNPNRRTNRSPRSYPLTGLVRFSLCGEKMVARPRDDRSRRYVCAKGPGNVGCGKIFQLAEPLEDLIAEAVFYRLDGEGLAHAIAARSSGESGTQDIEQALQDDRLRLDELADMYGRKDIVAREWTAARTPIQRRIAENEWRWAPQRDLLRSMVTSDTATPYEASGTLWRPLVSEPSLPLSLTPSSSGRPSEVVTPSTPRG